ncbi:hypothetical protein [Halostella sp. PRR32]|uniref:hypothetical protein n=1 Tax=Halostella sp. PRR32 TaxID=3098147 RepID=UPI002B1DE208|nr:hypothetical protein [Halostella sp. PRR32]
MNGTASRSLLHAKAGRVYIPPLAVLYLYSISSNVLYGYVATFGIAAAVAAHAHNVAIFGADGSFTNMDAQDERFQRWLIAIFKQGRLEDYPRSRIEFIRNIDTLPVKWKRLPTVVLTVFSEWMTYLMIGTALFGFWHYRSGLDFVGLTLLFALAVFLLQPLIWPMYWAVSNQRDKEHPPVDTPDHRKLNDFTKTLESNQGVRVTRNEYALESGGEVNLECEIEFSEKDLIQLVIQSVSFAYVGLVESTSLPQSKLKATLIDPAGNRTQFTIDRSLVHQYTDHQITETKFIEEVIKQSRFPNEYK